MAPKSKDLAKSQNIKGSVLVEPCSSASKEVLIVNLQCYLIQIVRLRHRKSKTEQKLMDGVIGPAVDRMNYEAEETRKFSDFDLDERILKISTALTNTSFGYSFLSLFLLGILMIFGCCKYKFLLCIYKHIYYRTILLSKIKESLPVQYQCIFTSATLTDDMTFLKKIFMTGPVVTLKFAILIAMFKLRLIIGKTIIFVNNTDRCYMLHSRHDKESGVSRGIDFHHVGNVVNFDFPTTTDSFLNIVIY
uniref:Transmembrane protein n=1 Tax=Heterorhabditis bacteriophora TaxID=37862 RepID=A0A1I7WDP0_HETBA